MKWQDSLIDFGFRYGFQIIGAIIILTVGFILARWAGGLLQSWLTRRQMEPPVRMLLVRVLRLLIMALALLLMLEKFGVNILPMVAGLSVIGVGVGLAAQGVLANMVAGLTIIFTKPFRVGEYIELNAVHGQVTAIELVNTTLLHPDLSKVVIPNRRVVGEILHNYGVLRQLDLRVGVAYGADLEAVLAAARAALKQCPRVLPEPAPVVGIHALGDSSIVISARPWVNVADVVPAHSEVYRAIVEQFRARQIEIPCPQHEVRLLPAAVDHAA